MNDAPGFNRKVAVFCAGAIGCNMLSWLKQLDVNVVCFADNDPAKQGIALNGIPVLSAAELRARHGGAKILVATQKYAAEVCAQLLALGFPEENICACMGEMYFEPFMRPEPHEVFVDAGGLDGGTSLDFIRWCGGDFDHIHVFEPDAANMEVCRRRLASEARGRATFAAAGLWSSATELKFQATCDGSSRVSESGETSIKTVALDDFLAGGRVTFIKMDIEGAELEALRGAAKTIGTHRPKLAISVYHKPEDILDIPLYIRELAPGYKFYLRHYTLIDTETVLYAVPE